MVGTESSLAPETPCVQQPVVAEKPKSRRAHPRPGKSGKESRLLISSVGSSPSRLALPSVSGCPRLTCAQNSESYGTLPMGGSCSQVPTVGTCAKVGSLSLLPKGCYGTFPMPPTQLFPGTIMSADFTGAWP